VSVRACRGRAGREPGGDQYGGPPDGRSRLHHMRAFRPWLRERRPARVGLPAGRRLVARHAVRRRHGHGARRTVRVGGAGGRAQRGPLGDHGGTRVPRDERPRGERLHGRGALDLHDVRLRLAQADGGRIRALLAGALRGRLARSGIAHRDPHLRWRAVELLQRVERLGLCGRHLGVRSIPASRRADDARQSEGEEHPSHDERRAAVAAELHHRTGLQLRSDRPRPGRQGRHVPQRSTRAEGLMPNSEYLGPSNGSTAGNGPLQLIGNNGVQPNLGEPTPSQSWMGDMGDSFFGTAAYTPAAQFGGNTQTNAYAQGLANQGLGMAGKDQILGANAAGSLNNVGNQYGVASQGAFGNASQALAAQNNALAMYQQAAQGNGPSAAQAQLQSGLDQSIQAQQAQAASARGGFGLANAQHQAAQNQAQLAGQAANNAAQLRAQEQQAAMAGYGNLGSTIQSQQAGNALAQQGNQLQAYGMGAGQQLAYNQLGQGNQLQYQNLANQALQAQT